MANHGGMRLTAALSSSRDLKVLILETDSPRSGAENEFREDLSLIFSSRTLDETSLNSELSSRKSCQ